MEKFKRDESVRHGTSVIDLLWKFQECKYKRDQIANIDIMFLDEECDTEKIYATVDGIVMKTLDKLNDYKK